MSETLTATPVMAAIVDRDRAQRRLNSGGGLRLAAKSVKATLVIDPSLLAGLVVPNGASPVPLAIEVGGQAVSGRLNPKTLRRAIGVINEHGAASVGVIVQGDLRSGGYLEAAGIVAQPKRPRGAADGGVTAPGTEGDGGNAR